MLVLMFGAVSSESLVRSLKTRSDFFAIALRREGQRFLDAAIAVGMAFSLRKP